MGEGAANHLLRRSPAVTSLVISGLASSAGSLAGEPDAFSISPSGQHHARQVPEEVASSPGRDISVLAKSEVARGRYRWGNCLDGLMGPRPLGQTASMIPFRPSWRCASVLADVDWRVSRTEPPPDAAGMAEGDQKGKYTAVERPRDPAQPYSRV